MKSVISATVIFIFIIVISVSSGIYVNRITDKMLQKIYENEIYISNNLWEKAENETNKLNKMWMENKTFMSINFNHSITDSVDTSIVKIENALKMRKKEDFIYESSNLKLLLLSLMEQQKMSIENIF